METCRICRCEETPEEPLYHPCRCSGSIKYVHQECLQEWLHTSKKGQQCELCNTPFAFTKIYSAEMPTRMPLDVYARELSISLSSALQRYLRYAFVTHVWVAVVPLASYHIFKVLFSLTHKLFIEQPQLDTMASYPVAAALLPKSLATPDSLVGTTCIHIFEGLVMVLSYVLVSIIIFFVREWVLNCHTFRQEIEQVAEEDRQQRQAAAAAAALAAVTAAANQRRARGEAQNYTQGEVGRATGFRGTGAFDEGPAAGDNVRVERRQDDGRQEDRPQEDRRHERHEDNAFVRDALREFQAQQQAFNEANGPMDAAEEEARRLQEEELQLAAEEEHTLTDFLGFTGPLKRLGEAVIATMALSLAYTSILVWSPYTVGRATMFTLEKNVDTINYAIDVVLHSASIQLARFGVPALPAAVQTYNTKLYNPATPAAHVFDVAVGYALCVIVGTIYLRVAQPKASVNTTQFCRLLVAMFKVIVMFGVELLVFPFACGLLLAFATLPLFLNASPMSRIQQFGEMSLTSVAIHWGVGTCYMIQFAMFVSMCRTTMRPGVLYFVRNPNDPSYQPVQEVLERPMGSQFKRILISAGMYAVFIGVCIGAVTLLYRLAYMGAAIPLNVPSSPSAAVESAATTGQMLLAYLQPLKINMGSDMAVLASKIIFHATLHITLYPILTAEVNAKQIANFVWSQILKRTCAALRLSSFIFNSRHASEETSSGGFLSSVLALLGRKTSAEPDGTYVRAPCSDSVDLRKSPNFFMEVTKDDEPLITEADASTTAEETDVPPPFSTVEYVVVYTPPNFRIRIFALLCTIWVCGALCVTFLVAGPIIMGRAVFALGLDNLWQDYSDLETFSIGAPLIGGLYLLGKGRSAMVALRFALIAAATVGLIFASSAAFELYVYRIIDLVMTGATSFKPTRSILEGCLAIPTAKLLLSHTGYSLPILGPLYNQAFENGARNSDIGKLARLVLTTGAAFMLVIGVPGMVGQILDNVFGTSHVAVALYPLVLVSAIIPIIYHQLAHYFELYQADIRDKLFMVGEKLHNRD